MNAEDEKKLQDEFFNCGGDVVRITNFAYALGRRAGMTEAAGVCEGIGKDIVCPEECAAVIEKARDA